MDVNFRRQFVFYRVVTTTENLQRRTIFVAGLPAGVYTLSIWSAKTVFRRKVLVQ